MIHDGRSSRNFKRGLCILVTVLVVFGFSFLIRILNDLFFVPPVIEESTYNQMMYDLFIGIPFDLIPIMLILYLHRKNLRAYKKQESDSDEGQSTSFVSSITLTSESVTNILRTSS